MINLIAEKDNKMVLVVLLKVMDVIYLSSLFAEANCSEFSRGSLHFEPLLCGRAVFMKNVNDSVRVSVNKILGFVVSRLQ